jgi:hypothetical protein
MLRFGKTLARVPDRTFDRFGESTRRRPVGLELALALGHDLVLTVRNPARLALGDQLVGCLLGNVDATSFAIAFHA